MYVSYTSVKSKGGKRGNMKKFEKNNINNDNCVGVRMGLWGDH